MNQPSQIYRTPSSITKRKIFLQHKNTQIKTTTSKMASKTTNTFSTAVTSSMSSRIQDKWVINLSMKELTPEEKSLLQEGLTCAVTPATISIKEYISTTTVAALHAGELNGVDCSGLYHDVNRILNTYTNKPIHTNITKAEHLALWKSQERKRTTSLLQLTKVWPWL